MTTRHRPHKWQFKTRFRRHAFGWRSQPAITRVKEAVSEIKRARRSDALLAAEGAVAFLERVSPALEQVDGSSGAIGNAVNRAIETLAQVITSAPADCNTRMEWLDRLWDAYQADDIPYIEILGDHWGELCATREIASHWADLLLEPCTLAWSPDPHLRGYFKGTTNCLSALLAAERYEDLLDLLERAPHPMWHYRRYGVLALAALGRRAQAIRYAEEGRGLNDSPVAIARTCEEILLAAGLADEAYERYGLVANRAGTYLAWFRAVARKYPRKAASQILDDLVKQTPGEEGKWFAAAKSAKHFDEAIRLANRTPCAPQTLTRAARDFVVANPAFAIEAGMAALRWLLAGHGYEITSVDVIDAYSYTVQAAEKAGSIPQTQEQIRALVSAGGDAFVTQILERQLALSR